MLLLSIYCRQLIGFAVVTLSLLHSPSFSEDVGDGFDYCIACVFLFCCLAFCLSHQRPSLQCLVSFDCQPSLLTALSSMAEIVALVRAHSGFHGQVIQSGCFQRLQEFLDFSLEKEESSDYFRLLSGKMILFFFFNMQHAFSTVCPQLIELSTGKKISNLLWKTVVNGICLVEVKYVALTPLCYQVYWHGTQS